MESLSNNEIFSHRVCPQCYQSKAHLSISASLPADHQEIKTLSKAWFGFFKEPTFFDFYRCSHCGLLYNKKFFSEQALEKLYSQLPDNTAGQNLVSLQRTQRGYYKFLAKETILSGNYLELGPDIGLFTNLVSTNQHVKKLFLFEPNLEVHEKLKLSTHLKPHQIFCDLFDFSGVEDNSIQIAVAIHVLDHLIGPKKFIDELFKKLSPGGIFFIVTHNERSFLARVLKKHWPAYCLQHPQLFNSKSTRSFLKSCGFNQIKTRKSINWFSLGYLLTHLVWALRLGKINPFRFLNFTLPLPLGNIMTVAQKPKTS